MGQARQRQEEIDAVKNQQYYLAEALDTQTGVSRYMSMQAFAPLLDIEQMAEEAEHMLVKFIEGRPAPDPMTKYYFIWWCFLQGKYGNKNSRVQTALAITDRQGFDQFNQRAANNTTNHSMFFAKQALGPEVEGV